MSNKPHPKDTRLDEYFDVYRQRLGDQLMNQVDRIEAARERLLASSQALSAGLFDHAKEPDQGAARRIDGMGDAMGMFLGRMQQQAVDDIDHIMRQHRALRRFQTDMARQQFFGTQAAPGGEVIDGVAVHVDEAQTQPGPTQDIETKAATPED